MCVGNPAASQNQGLGRIASNAGRRQNVPGDPGVAPGGGFGSLQNVDRTFGTDRTPAPAGPRTGPVPEVVARVAQSGGKRGVRGTK